VDGAQVPRVANVRIWLRNVMPRPACVPRRGRQETESAALMHALGMQQA
jgi:hypothetical protein